MDDHALLIVRVVVGALVAGHGAQKLFGWFGGGGLSGTAVFLTSIGLRPARFWAVVAGATELGSGALTLLGLLYPLAPVGILAAMTVAIATVHWGKPIWADRGGAELPLINAAVATALILTGPGAYGLDQTLGLGLLQWAAFVTGPILAVSAIGIAVAVLTRGGSQAAMAHEPVSVDGAQRPTQSPQQI
jgi:putative oxidoreductase